MCWKQLLDKTRLGDEARREEPHRPFYMQDLDRIAFSAPFRRLAHKTQVHPLSDNDHLHHRLIHSLETAIVGRSLGMEVGHWLEESGAIDKGEKHVVAGVVQAACMAHDIGNPPFGHAGEAAIGQWFARRFDTKEGIFAEAESLRPEFTAFEGNAQGFRILTQLDMCRFTGGMRLSHAVLGAFTKYPITALVQAQIADKDYCGVKKFGLFSAEEALFAKVAISLGLPQEHNARGKWWRRHPLVFLVEAADDICYNIIDLEDAVHAGELPINAVMNLLNKVLDAMGKERPPKQKHDHDHEWVARARARAIGKAIAACAEAFMANYDTIMRGTFSSSLLEVSNIRDAFADIKTFSKERIYTSARKIALEVYGHNVLHRILDGICPVFEALRRQNWQSENLGPYEARIVQALGLDLRAVQDNGTALHAMTDFVAGMSDRHAVKTAQILSGAGGQGLTP
ncbi:MAG: dNTP triphosphohydrolase [Rhodobacteraceae bacterium]|nr:dNTP triphosphohydrolase [Paracoccaceae bacterium]